MAQRLVLVPIPGRFAVCRLAAGAAVPEWAVAPWQPAALADRDRDVAAAPPRLISITHTADELSIVAPQELVDSLQSFPGAGAEAASGEGAGVEVKVERDFIAWRVAGTLDFSQVGVLAALTGALADAGVPVFVISTFDTDIVLVRAEHAARASEAFSHVAHVEPGAQR